MKPLPSAFVRGALFARLLANSKNKTICRAYGSEPDPAMKLHDQLPKNYKGFTGMHMNIDDPAFNWDWAFKKPVDPSWKIPQ